MAGLKGKSRAKRDWTWEAYAATGDTTALALGQGFGSLQRYRTLVAGSNFGKGVFTNLTPLTSNRFALTCPTGLPIFQLVRTRSTECIEAIEAQGEDLDGAFAGRSRGQPARQDHRHGRGQLRFAAGVCLSQEHLPVPLRRRSTTTSSAVEYPIGVFASNDSAGRNRGRRNLRRAADSGRQKPSSSSSATATRTFSRRRRRRR